jgi:hypothetical protein
MPRSAIVCAIACDEEPFADGFAENARACASAVVVGDTGSRDGTVRRLRDGGVEVIDVPPAVVMRGGFAAARNYVLDHLPRSSPFVHWVDLDERISLEADALPTGQPYGQVRTRTYAFDPDVDVSDWRQAERLPWSDEWHTRVHPNTPGVRWAGLVHEELWNSWHRNERLPITHHHLMNFRDPSRNERKRGLYAFLLWRGLTVKALRRGTNPWWFTERVRALDADALAAERDQARRFHDEHRACIDFDVDWRLPRPGWWRFR